MGAQISEL
jgi:hypothetical protein